MDHFKKPTSLLLAGAVLGTVAPGDDGSPYRDIRDDAFPVFMAGTGPASLGPNYIAQNTITGDEIAATRPERTITLVSSKSAVYTRWYLK